MSFNKPPSIWHRLGSVWYRHMRVYTRSLISNALPPFLEPILFLVGIGFGLGLYIDTIDVGPEVVSFISFLASGLMITAAMFTAAFECSFGTFIRLQFDKVYDGMLGAPISVNNLLIGEILWAGTKGFFFSVAVVIVTVLIGALPLSSSLLVPLIGFVAGLMFAVLGFMVTSLVQNINHFNFFFSGFISPMFFLCGVVFPIDNLPEFVRPITEALPLTHPVRIVRSLTLQIPNPLWWWDLLYIALFIPLLGVWSIRRLRRKLID